MALIRPHAIFADTSFFYSSLDTHDLSHLKAEKLVNQIETEQFSIVTTWEIIMETVTLLRTRYSYEGSMTFIREILPTLQLFDLAESDRQNVLKLYEKFSKDKRVSLCDMASYFIITKYLKNMPYVSFDDDFRSLGLTPFIV